MEGGTHAGVGIHGVDKPKQLCEYIVIDEALRAQVLPVGIYDIDDHSDNLCNDDVFLQVLKVFRVVEHEIQKGDHDQCVPEYIGNQKVFAKRNQIIQWTVDYMAALGRNQIFGQEIGNKITYPSEQPLQMGKTGIVELGKTKFPIINNRLFQVCSPSFRRILVGYFFFEMLL